MAVGSGVREVWFLGAKASQGTNCSIDRSDVFKDRSYLFLKHHGGETTREPARRGAVHDKVDLFFSHPTPGLTRGWTRCFNILIGRRNGRFRDLAFYNDILPAFRSQ